jgi:minor extracellular serine protease Vpr
LGAVANPPADGAAGNGQETMNSPTVTIGGSKALVSFSGLAPGFVGLYQVNAQVPATLAKGNQKVTIEMAGASSNLVLLPLE